MASIFAIFLVFLSVASGLIWLLDVKVYAPKRQLKLAEAESQLGKALAPEAQQELLRQSALAETAQSIFPIVLAITIFRSFIFEPFQIPSGSMRPTLFIGDFILVQKFSYGIKDPVTRTKLIDVGTPQRGDVAVFKYPEDPMVDFIKRIVALPGDHIRYTNKTLYIKPSCEREPDSCQQFHQIDKKLLSRDQFISSVDSPLDHFETDMLGLKHEILTNPYATGQPQYFHQGGLAVNEWLVPEGSYFGMGDNRDNSRDSRFWGFIPDDNLVGKAVFIWISFEFNREPDSWISFIPTDVRFERVGAIH